FRMFLQVTILQQQGRSESQIVADLSAYLGRKINPYQVKFALRDSRKLSLSFLKKTLVSLIETDYQIKTGRLEKDYLFD
ncbi:DNA polymerase III subunit delta, partial [Streptococcus pyogenes]